MTILAKIWLTSRCKCTDAYSVDYDGGDEMESTTIVSASFQAGKQGEQYINRELRFCPVLPSLLLGWFFASGTYTYCSAQERLCFALLEPDDDLNDSSRSALPRLT
jgi:hypothetical protein